MPDPIMLTIAETDIVLAWNVRGDAARPIFAATVEKILGVPLPTKPHASARSDEGALLSLGPRSWLFVGDGNFASSEFDAARRTLNAAGGALFDVSSSYVAWTVSGEAAARTLNRGCPLDLHRSAFRPGQCTQSLLGHVSAVFYRPDERDAWIVMIPRSYAADAWEQLDRYASTDGYAIGPPTTFRASAAI